jgi:gliding motility-associated-like protein
MKAGTDQVVCFSSEFTLFAEGGISYSWSPSAQITDDLDEQYPLTFINTAEDFYVKIFDQYACIVIDTLSVTLEDAANCNINVHNAFSPNADGQNDFWIIDGIEGFPENIVRIYNRWGDVLADFANYDNNTVVWDGTNKSGRELPSGTYFYVVEVGGTQNEAGWIQIVK